MIHRLFVCVMFVAMLTLTVRDSLAQQSSITPTTPANPSLQSGSFWSSGPPKSSTTPLTPTTTAPNPAQPSATLPTGAPPSLNPPINDSFNNSFSPASAAPVLPNTAQPITSSTQPSNSALPNNTAPPSMPSLNPPVNNFAPNNIPNNAPPNNAKPLNSSAYGSGANLPPASGALQPSTSVYGPSMPLGPALTSPASTGPALAPPSNSPSLNNSLPPNNSFGPSANSFPQPQPSLPPASNYGQSSNAQLGSSQNTLPPAQPTSQPQVGEQSPPLNPSQFTAQGINQRVGGTTLQSAPTIATWGEFETAKAIAMVGGEPIISYDIEEFFIRGMEAMRAKDPNAAPPSEEEKKAYSKIILKQMIETKILYADALKNVPKENLEKMRAGVAKEFETNYIKRLLEKNNVKTRADLEKAMIKKGTTLERESQKFFEQSLADMWERQNVKKISVVPLADVVSYYTTHMSEYEFPAKARWEQLMISFGRVSDKVQAQNILATMGNKVIQGAPLGDIAEKESHGPTAYNKGQYDWTSKDALKSKVLNDAIFTLPVGQLSPILEDESGYHIIRVIERKDAGCVPFEEAQVAIRKNLIEEEQKKIKDAYIKKVKERIAVWTIFDNEKPANEVANEQDPLRK